MCLLKANLAFETEQEEMMQMKLDKTDQGKGISERNNNEDGDSDEDGFSSDEEEVDATIESKLDEHFRCIVFLQEIRSFGAKPALMLVAQAMSKFWLSQRNYLGYSCPNDPLDATLGVGDEERCARER